MDPLSGCELLIDVPKSNFYMKYNSSKREKNDCSRNQI